MEVLGVIKRRTARYIGVPEDSSIDYDNKITNKGSLMDLWQIR